MQTRAYILSAIATGIIIFFGAAAVAAVPSGPCRPVSDRTSEVGCWVLSEHPIGELAESEVFWHLDAYSSRAAAEAAKSPLGTVVEVFRKDLAVHHCRKRLASSWRPSRRGNRAARDQCTRTILGGILGGGIHSRHDRSRTYPLRPGSVVYAGWRNMCGDARGEASWTPRGQKCHRACRSADASHRHGHRKSTLACAASPRVGEARHDMGAGLDPQGVV